jgi:secondary thiamine-phosphate synthase enzyme
MDVIIRCESFEMALREGPDVGDITAQLQRLVAAAGVREGTLHACTVGSTASITTIEYEPGAVQDLKDAVRRLAPPEMAYAHEMTWHDGNGHSHVQAALLGPSVVVPIRDGKLRLGTWQQVVLLNHDVRPRRRSVEVTIIGAS